MALYVYRLREYAKEGYDINDGQVIALCHNHRLLTGIYSLPGFDGKTCNLLASLIDFGA